MPSRASAGSAVPRLPGHLLPWHLLPRHLLPRHLLIVALVLLACALPAAPAFADPARAGGDADCDVAPPPAAAAAGYTALLFCDDFNEPSTFDFDAAGCPASGPCAPREAAGFKWFRAGKPFDYPQTPREGIGIEGGVLTLATASSSNLAVLTTYAREGGGFGGFSVKGRGAYFEAALAFEVPPPEWFEQNDPWYAPRRRGTLWRAGWPAFWSMDTCHLYGRCTPYMELDFFEYLSYPFAGRDSYIGALHRWLDLRPLGEPCDQKGDRPDLPKCHQMEQSNNWSFWNIGHFGERGRRKNSVIQVPAGTDWTGRFNVAGMLLKRGESLDFYFNDELRTRNGYAEYPWLAIADEGDFPVILGSKDWPMRVDWVRVWGAPE